MLYIYYILYILYIIYYIYYIYYILYIIYILYILYILYCFVKLPFRRSRSHLLTVSQFEELLVPKRLNQCIPILEACVPRSTQCGILPHISPINQPKFTTFQTEVPEILPYCGPINSAEVQTQYSKRFTPKIHSSPHNRQNQTLIAMHQLILPLNPAEPQSSPH